MCKSVCVWVGSRSQAILGTLLLFPSHTLGVPGGWAIEVSQIVSMWDTVSVCVCARVWVIKRCSLKSYLGAASWLELSTHTQFSELQDSDDWRFVLLLLNLQQFTRDNPRYRCIMGSVGPREFSHSAALLVATLCSLRFRNKWRLLVETTFQK